MFYHSTRGLSDHVSDAQAILTGLAPDGGLYLPEQLPKVDWQALVQQDTLSIATAILSAFFPGIPQMEKLVHRAYQGKFETENLTPTVSVGDLHILELFRGPTSAFKDVALCMLPQLMTAAKEICGQEADILILTATSGDTGKAALMGFQDVPGIRICVFYPVDGVSATQKLQMMTQEGDNVRVCAIEGNFDDAQRGVKEIFSADTGLHLSSANSINIGRLVPQIAYYFTAYRDLLKNGTIQMGDEVNFSVPTGNFGDILAGYLAKKLGLPVGKLLCASNANRVLTDFLETGRYNRLRPLYLTSSPSMDILVSSNLERLLYLETKDGNLVGQWMEKLNTEGRYQLPEDVLCRIQKHFAGFACGEFEGLWAIHRIWGQYHYLMDPHTANGWVAAEHYRAQTGDLRPMVVLSTASPYKFSTAVIPAILAADACGTDHFADFIQHYHAATKNLPEAESEHIPCLNALTGVAVPSNLLGLDKKPRRHTDVIQKDQMMAYILR